MKYKLSELKEHPDNNQIYSPTDLEELKNSLLIHGQLEPIVINKDKVIISGHRRFNALKELGIEECDARIEEYESDVVALIQFNKQRQKTHSDILNESTFLGKELQKQIGRGRPKKEERRIKMNTRDEIAKRLDINPSLLQKLKFIENHDATYLYKIDRKEISVSKAVKEIKEKLGDSKQLDAKTILRRRLVNVFKDENYSLGDITDTLKTIYPYSLELTNTSSEKRDELVKELDMLRKMNSREYMYYRKFDDFEYINHSEKDISFVKSLLPTLEELEDWYHSDNPLGLVEVIDCETDKTFNHQTWMLFRHHIASFEFNSGRGRYINFFVTIPVKGKRKLLGLATLGSDVQGYKARDNHIGWSKEVRAKKREHIVNMRTCIPTQPLGFNFLGGKLIALLMHRAVPIYEKKYKDKVIAIITTSLHGSFSQYSGMKNWIQLEKTKGEVIVEPKREIYEFWIDWFRENFSEQFEYSSNLSNIKNYRLTKILGYLGIDMKRYQHSHERGVFICPLYRNYIDFLNEKITTRQLIPQKIDEESWLDQSHKRYSSLKKSKKLQKDTLFIENDDSELFYAYLNQLET